MTQHYSTNILLILGVSILSLTFGILLQTVPVTDVVPWIGFGMVWLVGVMLFGFSLKNNLILISLFFLKPYTLVFYATLVLLLVGWITENYKQSFSKTLLPYTFPFLVLLVTGLISLSKTYVDGGFLYFTATIIVPPLCFLMIYNIERKENDLLTWTRAVSIIAMLLSVYGVLVALMHPDDRIGSTWSNAMTINGFYTVGFFFALANAARNEIRMNKMLWISIAFVIFLGMVYTYTRIALVAVFFGLFIMMFRIRRIRFYAILSLGMMTLFIPSSMAQRIIMGLEIDLSIIIRLIVWVKSIGLISSHPFFGIGFSTWKDIYHGMIPFELLYAQHAHNLILNIALEIGVFGALAFFYIIIVTLFRYYKRVVKSSFEYFHLIVLVAMLSLLVACLTDIFIQQYQISIVFWITMALLYRESQVIKPKEDF